MNNNNIKYERDILFLDLEFYVPKKDRDMHQYSLTVNPTKPDHFLIGGVFTRYTPNKDDINRLELNNYWIWDYQNEKELLSAIYRCFISSWEHQKNKNGLELDICGIGISKFDIPALYIRCVMNNVDKSENLFDIFLKTHQIDLSNVAIPFIDDQPQLHPVSANRIYRKLEINKVKTTGGINVWEMYDNKEYSKIKERTMGEVRDCVIIFNRFSNSILKDKKFSVRQK